MVICLTKSCLLIQLHSIYIFIELPYTI